VVDPEEGEAEVPEEGETEGVLEEDGDGEEASRGRGLISTVASSQVKTPAMLVRRQE
jgi:hypothetical protein